MDYFFLNGYYKKTNPYLEKDNVISFTNVWSCGTSTVTSVPCIFSFYNRDNYNKNQANNIENILDILKRVAVNVVWLDNNSSSQGVVDRVLSFNYKSAD